jgi:hypothetical protein
MGSNSIKCIHPHYCYDWDGMFIFPGTAEFESCLCNCTGKSPCVEDLDLKDLYLYYLYLKHKEVLDNGISLKSERHPHPKECSCSLCKEEGYP